MEVLPEDLVRECLLRVPYESHHNLKAVSRSWKAMLSNPKFYEDRKISGTSEQLICLIQHDGAVDYAVTVYDPAKGTWERLPPINDPRCHRMPFFCECVSVNRKLVLIGGEADGGMLLKSVYIYDFESAKWSRGADMPITRDRFACSVSPSTGLIYVAGGRNDNGNSLGVAEVYDQEKDKWETLPPMIRERGMGCLGVFMDEKFFVFGGGQMDFDQSAEVFDPSAGTWTLMEDMWSFRIQSWRDCAVANSFCGRDLYVFSEREVMKYDPEKSNWSAVASLPENIPYFTSATQWRDLIFVTGSGWDGAMKELYLLFNPSTGQSTEVKCEGGNNHVFSATTVEI